MLEVAGTIEPSSIELLKDIAVTNQKGLIALGAGLAVGLTGIGSGIAEKDIGAAAVGAFAEREELFAKGLIMTVIPESIVIFGLVVALVLMFLFINL